MGKNFWTIAGMIIIGLPVISLILVLVLLMSALANPPALDPNYATATSRQPDITVFNVRKIYFNCVKDTPYAFPITGSHLEILGKSQTNSVCQSKLLISVVLEQSGNPIECFLEAGLTAPDINDQITVDSYWISDIDGDYRFIDYWEYITK